MILGEMKTVSGRFGEEVTCVPFENADLIRIVIGSGSKYPRRN